jgi:hypothetical protein
MFRTNETTLASATGRLRWALAVPRRYGDAGWGQRVGRALASLQDALDRHAAFIEFPHGLLSQVADPALLPFTRLIRRAGELRQEHQSLREGLRGLGRQLQGLTRDRITEVESGGSTTDRLREEAIRVFTGMAAISRQAEKLLADIEAHCAREADLGGETVGRELTN